MTIRDREPAVQSRCGGYFLVISMIIFFPNIVLWLPRLIVPTSVGCFPNPNGGGYICPP
jgi:C4-dicarboxylate transporter, DctM subunit